MGRGDKRRLLLVSCSNRKHSATVPVLAWDLYDGVAFRLIKAAQREQRWPDDIDIWILSAEYGVISPQTSILPYNRKMTIKRALELQPEMRQTLDKITKNNNYSEIFIFAGYEYLISLEPINKCNPHKDHIRVAKGRIGEKLKSLKEWALK
jgi:cytoplasmic iron level regulating protein YaaA (DUF328/UPF0246 family)